MNIEEISIQGKQLFRGIQTWRNVLNACVDIIKIPNALIDLYRGWFSSFFFTAWENFWKRRALLRNPPLLLRCFSSLASNPIIISTPVLEKDVYKLQNAPNWQIPGSFLPAGLQGDDPYKKEQI